MTIAAELLEGLREANVKDQTNFLKKRPQCLLVEDDASDAALSVYALKQLPVDLKIAASGDEAIKLLDASLDPKHPDYDIVFLDLLLRGSAKQGIQVLEHIRKNFPTVHVVLVSGHIDQGVLDLITSYKGRGAYLGVVSKPLVVEEVQDILHKHRLDTEQYEI